MELSDAPVRRAESRQLEQLQRHAALEFGLGAAAVAAAVVAALPFAAPGVVLGWLAVVGSSFALRFVLLRRARRDAGTTRPSAAVATTVAVTAGVSALGFGALAAWLATAHGLAVGAPLLVLAAAVASLLVTSPACPGACGLAAIGGALLPPLAGLSVFAGHDGLGAILALAFAGAATGAAARVLAGRARAATEQEATIEHLHDYLDQRRDQIEKLQVELKTTQGKRDQAEQELRRNAADLGLVQGKAKALADTLERVSPLDQSTGLDNRRHFEQVFDAEWRRATREGKPMSMVMVDVDECEHYVASYGHQSGDTVLKRIAQTLRAAGRRPGDAAGRLEDTRLALILPGCDARNATRLAEAVRKRIEALNIPHAGLKERTTLTVHVGVAMMKPSRTVAPADLVKRVEGALYEARFQGGNRVVGHQPLSRIRLEHWDQPNDGPLSEQAMMQKLLVWGYDTTREVLKPGARIEPSILEHEYVVAALSGELRLDVEGHSMSIRAGDCVIIPAGLELGMEAAGTKPVLKLTAARHA